MRKIDIERRSTERRKTALHLHNHGKTYREIAEVIGCGRSTAANIVKEAKWQQQRQDQWYGGLSVRASNALINAGCRSKDDAANLTDQQLLSTQNVGKLTVCEIMAWLEGNHHPTEHDLAIQRKKLAVRKARARLEDALAKLDASEQD